MDVELEDFVHTSLQIRPVHAHRGNAAKVAWVGNRSAPRGCRHGTGRLYEVAATYDLVYQGGHGTGVALALR